MNLGSDPAAPNPRLGLLALRAWCLVAFWCAVLVGCAFGLNSAESSAARLLAEGTRTPGQVVTVYDPRGGSGSPSMVVRYTAGVSRTAEIERSSTLHYAPGQSVTVVYDPADPTDVRTTEEENDSQASVGFFAISGILAVFLLPFSAVAAVRWRLRDRAVRRTGWRAAVVTVRPDYPVRRGRHAPDILVRYSDGAEVRLRASTSTHGVTYLKERAHQPAWIGGTRRHMVVMLPDGRWGKKGPYAVPAFLKHRGSPPMP
jgi:hypothetical protein